MMNKLILRNSAFTLLELSVVIVVIGLVIGGVLVGQTLVRAAVVRATVTQLEKFKTAANNFYTKYYALPGDISGASAIYYGLAPRGNYAGEGDNNGLIEGVTANTGSSNNGLAQGTGETTMFWNDLTYANGAGINLIEGTFRLASSTALPGRIYGINLNNWLPSAKLGGNNYYYIYSTNDVNYIGLSAVTQILSNFLYSNTTISVRIAYDIDNKIDDGQPLTGVVLARYVNGNAVLGASGVPLAGDLGNADGGTGVNPTPSSALTCYDNGNIGGASMHYSYNVNGGSGANCALSFVLK